MSDSPLSEYLSQLEDAGELIRITASVDPVLEISEIVSQITGSAGDGPAVLFDNIQGDRMPAVYNVLGSPRRILRALGVDSLKTVSQRVSDLLAPEIPQGFAAQLQWIPRVNQLLHLPPKISKTGDCQQVVHMGSDVNLGRLPIATYWPNDSGPSIHAGQCFTLNPDHGVRDVGRYPLEIRSHNTLAIHWNAHQDGHANYQAYQQQQRQMPIAVALGGDPLNLIMAEAPLPAHTDECLFGGFLKGRPLELVKCRTNDIHIPTSADIIIEGYIDVDLPPEPAGQLGSATGYYTTPGLAPIMRVTAVTHRANPIYVGMQPGRTRPEFHCIHHALERMMLPVVQLMVPELVDMHLPRYGVGRNYVFLSLNKQYPQHARKVMQTIWGLGRLMCSKIIVVVDDDVDVQDESAVWHQVGANAHPGRDVVFSEGPTHHDDHAAPVQAVGHHMGIDATHKLQTEGHPRQWPTQLETTPAMREHVAQLLQELGVASAVKDKETDHEAG